MAIARNRANLGMASNWNACADLASREFGEIDFLLKLDADDQISPCGLEVLADRLQSEDKTELAFCSTQADTGQGAGPVPSGLFVQLLKEGFLRVGDSVSISLTPRQALYLMLRYDNLLPSSGTMWRGNGTRRSGRFDVSYRWAADYEFWTRRLRRGGAAYCPECAVIYRVHSSSVSASMDSYGKAREVALVTASRLRDSGSVLGPGRRATVAAVLLWRLAGLVTLKVRGNWSRVQR
jgi:glycosyltransferase involved in cell wall biosynthesis